MGRARELALPLGGAWRCPPACEASAPPGCGDRRGGDPGGRSVFPPSLHPSVSEVSSGAATRSGRLQAGPPLAPGYRPVPEPGRSLCTPRTVRRGHGPRCPLRGRGLHPASGSPRGYRVPQTPRIFVAARSEVVLGDLKVSVSNFGVGVTTFCPAKGIR